MKSIDVCIAVVLFCCMFCTTRALCDEKIVFNRDVRPILAEHCFTCHGPDEESRESGLRLDLREEAVDFGAITPGNVAESPLVDRINSDDPELVMPPPDSHERLTYDQRRILRLWIEQGARFDEHWAFVPPKSGPVPTEKQRNQIRQSNPALLAWPRNEIDWLVLPKILQAGLKPSPEADRYTLVRRLYLDLIGMPPTIEEADRFVFSQEPDAYEELVDQLLQSPRYGEHWATPWLDLARYADTNGYEKDRPRSIWPYRDWVIRALNADMPYDQFSIEQLAGDMLENPTADQQIATGFHRNTMLNEEGGIDPLEYRFLAMVDRVSTTGTVWMGLTVGCVQCHSHKYDPISHTDYYAMMALMNNAEEPDFSIPNADTTSKIQQKLSEIRDLEDALVERFSIRAGAGEGEKPDSDARLKDSFKRWLAQSANRCSSWTNLRPAKMATNLPRLEIMDDDSIFSSGDVTKRDEFVLTFEIGEDQLPIQAIRLEALPDRRLPAGGPGRTYYEGRKGDFFVSEVSAEFDGNGIIFQNSSHSFSSGSSEKSKSNWVAEAVFDGDGSTGWRPGNNKGERLCLVLNLAEPITQRGRLKIDLLFERHYVASLGRFRLAVTSDENAVANAYPVEIEEELAKLDQTTNPPQDQEDRLERYFLLTTPELADERKAIDRLQSRIPKLNRTMVLRERPANHRRPTFRHHRGEYLSPREEVTPAIPEVFRNSSTDQAYPQNRLELASWLVSDSNPLGARVAVNRAWRAFFGMGLVRTNGDFGVQVPPPRQQPLLDWLAVQFVADNWSQKQLHRRIVLSATYRQSSSIDDWKQNQDPENYWLARAARFRLPGETIRDCHLSSSGKLSNKMFGPGVYPPQPAGVTELAYGGQKWKPSQGEDRYRRSVYTFRKRTAAFAAFTVFDGPTGEACTARRNRSNTPLQALTVLNDEMFVELAQAMAKNIYEKQSDSSDIDLVTTAFRNVLTRPPQPEELESIMLFFNEQSTRLSKGELDSTKISSIEQDNARIAALAMTCRVMMNLDEAISRY